MNVGVRAGLVRVILRRASRRPAPPAHQSYSSTARPEPPPQSAPPANPPPANLPPANPPASLPASLPTNAPTDPVSASSSAYRVVSAVVLSRPPLLTQELDEFEESFYHYQWRLNQRLQLPFTRYFYFKKRTPADLEWKRKRKLANAYTGFGPRGWADELPVGDNGYKEDDFGYKRLVETTVTGEDKLSGERKGNEGEEVEALLPPASRTTKADLEDDRRSLDRKGSRTLYLLVKEKGKGKHAWRFPTSPLVGNESLRSAAERTLKEAAGVNMNTWFIGNIPINFWVYNYPQGYKDEDKTGRKVFFMKARILAGQANLKDNTLDLEDFMWLTKDEMEKIVGFQYYRAIRHMLPER